MDKTQKVDKKKVGSFCLVIVVLWSLKSQNWLIFVFSANASKKSVTVWTKYLCASEKSHLASSENATD